MTPRVNDAANYLSLLSGRNLSNLPMHKILYIADMNFVGKTGDRLLDENFQAWDHGPVLPSLYRRCKAFGSKPVPNVFWGSRDISNERETNMLQLAWDRLRDLTPGQLVGITHSDLGAWVRRYSPGARNIVISKKDMEDEYERRRESNRKP